MDNANIPKEVLRAALAWFVALLAGLLLKSLGAGKAVTAAASGAAGGLATLAIA